MERESWSRRLPAIVTGAAFFALISISAFGALTTQEHSLQGLRDTRTLLALAGLGLLGAAWDTVIGPRDLLAWAAGHLREWRKTLNALAIAAQLGVLLFAAQAFALENGAFNQTILWVVLGGFLVHYFSPEKLRQPVYLLVFLVGLAAVLGPRNAAFLLVIGLALIGLASLPLPHTWRVALLVAVGAGLALMRAGLVPDFFPESIWPILGAIFMFRLILYVFITRNDKNRPTYFETLSYFFLLPNIVFPLFPVVDLSVFKSSRYAVDEFRIYQRGVDWILRGFFHLILYRVVNYYFVLGGFEIETIADLWQSMVAGYALYLRVSGQFHVIIGILHLFGYYLPETHHLYFLSTDFGEIWRRMNIYWKEFIQKTVFYPTYFHYRHLDERRKMAMATIASFIATWFLHAYQWFWLRGQFLLTWPDVLFWTILAALVLQKNLSDLNKPRTAYLTRPQITPRLVLRRTLNASTVFFTMAFLWSFWDAPTIGEWTARFRVVQVTSESLLVIVLGTLGIMTAIGIGIYFELRRYTPASLNKDAVPAARFFRHAAVTAAVGLVLVVLGNPDFITRTPAPVKEVLADLRVSRLSSRDRQLLERGYYEDLIGVDRFNQDLWQLYEVRPTDWVDIEMTDAVLLEPDTFINYRLKPDTEIIFHNTFFKTNRWGMRDQDYTKSKPADTTRIALVGSSRTMGSGVELEDTFEYLVEDRLNKAFTGAGVAHYEILNMSVAGYTLLHQVLRMDEILAFQPDVVIIEVNPSYEMTSCFRYMLSRDRAGVAMPDAFLQDLLAAGEITRQTSETAAVAQLMPYGEDLFDWAFTTMAEQILAAGAQPLILHYPSVVPEDQTEDITILFESAVSAGFEVIDLTDVFRGEDANDLIIAPWDFHPNAVGHRILAEALLESLAEKGSIPPTP